MNLVFPYWFILSCKTFISQHIYLYLVSNTRLEKRQLMKSNYIKLNYTIMFKLIAWFNSFLLSYQSTEQQNSLSKLLQNATKKWKIHMAESSWSWDKSNSLVILPVMAFQNCRLGQVNFDFLIRSEFMVYYQFFRSFTVILQFSTSISPPPNTYVGLLENKLNHSFSVFGFRSGFSLSTTTSHLLK